MRKKLFLKYLARGAARYLLFSKLFSKYRSAAQNTAQHSTALHITVCKDVDHVQCTAN